MDDADARGEAVHFGQQVAGHEDRHALLAGQCDQQLTNLHHAGRVEAVGGLVEDHQLRVVQQRAGETQPLQVAGGERAGAGRLA